MKKALLVIDYTEDFVALDGALTCGQPAIDIEKDLAALTQQFIDAGDFVVFAVDLHDDKNTNHPEHKLFPPHNIKGSKGRKQFGQLETVYQANKDRPNVYYMDKTRYSAFAGTDLYLRLKEQGINNLHVAGVCTDICVLHTMVDGYNLGFDLTVYEKCTASFNPAGHVWALEHFKNCLGATVL